MKEQVLKAMREFGAPVGTGKKEYNVTI